MKELTLQKYIKHLLQIPILNLLGKGFPSGKDSNVFLPIIIILFVVILRKRFKSAEIFVKSCPLLPIMTHSQEYTCDGLKVCHNIQEVLKTIAKETKINEEIAL